MTKLWIFLVLVLFLQVENKKKKMHSRKLKQTPFDFGGPYMGKPMNSFRGESVALGAVRYAPSAHQVVDQTFSVQHSFEPAQLTTPLDAPDAL